MTEKYPNPPPYTREYYDTSTFPAPPPLSQLPPPPPPYTISVTVTAPPYEPNAPTPSYETSVPTPTYLPNATSPPPYTPTVRVSSQEMNWCENNMRNKPQSNSTGGAALLFIIAGMNMSWSAFNPNASNANGVDWFIGAMIGAWIGAAINTGLNRKYVIMVAAAVNVIDGIIYIAASDSNVAVTTARYFDGLAIGVVFVPTMVLIGEESVKYLRGMLASSIELMCFYVGISIQVCFDQTINLSNSDFNMVQMQGIMNVTFGLLGLMIVGCMYIESPIYHLLRDEEETAIDCLRRLQTPFVVTNETYEQLRDHKHYVRENNALTPRKSVKQALPALFVLILYRVWVAVSFSALTCAAIVQATKKANFGDNWPLMVILFGNLGFIAVLIVCFAMDTVGRTKPTLIGAFVCGAISLIIGLLWDNVFHTPLDTRMIIITCLLLIFQFFAGISTAASSVYLTEAFPLSIKAYFISFPFIVQMLVQLIINCNYDDASLAAYFYATGIIALFIAILACMILPDTKKVPLLAAQNMFKHLCGSQRS